MKNEFVRKSYAPCPLWKRLLLRFARGAFFAFVPLFTSFAAMSPETWDSALIYSMIVSAIAGGLQAIEKWSRESDSNLFTP